MKRDRAAQRLPQRLLRVCLLLFAQLVDRIGERRQVHAIGENLREHHRRCAVCDEHQHLLATSDDVLGGSEQKLLRERSPHVREGLRPLRGGVVLPVAERTVAQYTFSQLDRPSGVDEQSRAEPVGEQLRFPKHR